MATHKTLHQGSSTLETWINLTDRPITGQMLTNMSADIVAKILDATDDDHELPVGIRQNDVPLSKLTEFAAFMDEIFILDESCEYEVGYSSD